MSEHGYLGRLALGILRAAFRRFVTTTADKGHLEVESKFGLSDEQVAKLPEVILSKGFHSIGISTMTDNFLPSLIPGEMLRVRREQINEEPVQLLLTFKQWVETSTGRERRETERAVRSTVAAMWLAIGRLLSGEPLATFGKKRHLYEGDLDGQRCIVSLDDVHGLGRYSGWYMEIELIVPIGVDPRPHRLSILALAARLLGSPPDQAQRSYMDMLAASRKEANEK